MNCQDIGRELMSRRLRSLRLTSEAEQHVNDCKRCQDLLGALDLPGTGADAPAPGSPASGAGWYTSSAIETMLTDLHPVQAVAQDRFSIGFAGIFILVTALGVYRLGPRALAVMSPVQAGGMFLALAISAGLIIWSLVRQMFPGRLLVISPRILPVALAISLALLIGLLFTVRYDPHFWAASWFCIKNGSVLAILAAVPLWLLLRRGTIISPRLTGPSTGFLAGLAGMSAIEIHCPNLDMWHILVSHLGIPVFGAGAGLVAGTIAETLARRSYRRRHQSVW